MVFVDQSPIGKTARSNPVSYRCLGRGMLCARSLLRRIVPRTWLHHAKFSFGSGDGCPTCSGSGFEHIRMVPRATSTCAAPTAMASATG